MVYQIASSLSQSLPNLQKDGTCIRGYDLYHFKEITNALDIMLITYTATKVKKH